MGDKELFKLEIGDMDGRIGDGEASAIGDGEEAGGVRLATDDSISGLTLFCGACGIAMGTRGTAGFEKGIRGICGIVNGTGGW